MNVFPIVLQMLEKCIRDKIALRLLRHNLIRPQEHGYVTRKSCLTSLSSFPDEITKCLDQDDRVELCHLGCQKAFDPANHIFFLPRLTAMNADECVSNRMQNCLTNQNFYVVIDGVIFSKTKACSVVPHGCALGPLLFLVFTNELTAELITPCILVAVWVKVLSNPASNEIQSDLDTNHR